MSAVVARELETRTAMYRAALRTAAKRVADDPGDVRTQAGFEAALDDLVRVHRASDALGSDPRWGGRSFFTTVLREFDGDPVARRRLDAWREEQRAATSADFGGLVVPDYLTGHLVGSGHSSRPLADRLTEPMGPDGVQFIASRVSTGATAEDQEDELDAITDDDPVTTEATAPMSVAASAVQLSFQAVQRMAPDAMDRLVQREVLAAVDAQVESSIITADGSGNVPTGLLEVSGTGTYSLTSTDPADLLDALSRVSAVSAETAGTAPDTVVMAPRRWRWLLANAGTYSAALTPTSVLNMAVVESPSMPLTLSTDQDRVIVLPSSEVILAERPPEVMVKRDASGLGPNLLARLMVERQYSFIVPRPAAVQIIDGAGTANPYT